MKMGECGEDGAAARAAGVMEVVAVCMLPSHSLSDDVTMPCCK
jgi:hypothetical protein